MLLNKAKYKHDLIGSIIYKHWQDTLVWIHYTDCWIV